MMLHRRFHLLAYLAAAAVAGGCGAPRPQQAPETPGGGIPAPEKPAAEARVTIFVPVLVNDEMRLERRSVAVTSARPGPKETVQALLDYRIAGQRMFPEGVRVLDFRVDKDGVAVVDLSVEIQQYGGGSMEEAGALNALVMTAAQFDGVKSVRFLCDGKEMETLGGHADLTVPLVPDRRLLVEQN
ncbi:MAG: hypothetical protein KatS3mg024_1940 [Armatimonadota bacterium]|nr:MAG: hypothetical protein KatS3mg024_1940 [Armatimonadota bacterium]